MYAEVASSSWCFLKADGTVLKSVDNICEEDYSNNEQL